MITFKSRFLILVLHKKKCQKKKVVLCPSPFKDFVTNMIFRNRLKSKKVDFVNEINFLKNNFIFNALVNNLLYPNRGTSRSNDATVWHL